MTIYLPQTIYLLFLILGVFYAIRDHGKPRTVLFHDATPVLIAITIQVLLLYFGGFFDCLIK